MEQIQKAKDWFHSLPVKEQRMVFGTSIIIVITLFYLMIWEPLHVSLQDAKLKKESQDKAFVWMQQSATEVKSLRATGSRSTIRDKNKPTTLVVEQTIKNAGLSASVSKIESSGKNGARITLNEAAFNQVLIWLNTLSTHNGIQVISANIERGSKPGRANIRLTLERP